MLPIALDAMGGDRAPADIVTGGVRAHAELGLPVLLVGAAGSIAATGANSAGLDVLDCAEVIDMHDDPATAVRRKKDSSLVRAAEAVRDGRASAMVSAGNTGATMASALLRMGRIRGVARPAIVTPIPGLGAHPTAFLDAGANAECQPEWLVQFAQMGAVFARSRYGVDRPRVALLSIGEEDTKGTPLVKEANALLRLRTGDDFDFVGNVEGRDLMAGGADVIVTDGFTGNVALKTLEGGLRAIQKLLLGAMTANDELTAAFDVMWPALVPVIEHLDPETTGGAMLLGVDGVCIISHGSSSPTAVVNALRTAADMVEADLVGAIGKVIA
jgi:phosphate acyltransferase